MRIPSLPISVDQAYETQIITRGKGKTRQRMATKRLSSKGLKYKRETRAYIIKHYPELLTFFVADNPYLVIVLFTFQGREKLYTKSWLEENPKKRAKNRYKRLDVSNRTKLFEDALAEAVGVDDNHNFFIGVGKTWAQAYEATDVWIFNRETERDNPVDALINQLRASVGPQSH